MPTYEYRCTSCDHQLEAFQSIKDAPLKLCPACSKESLERLISGGNFILKGGGWYKDLYSSPKSNGTSSGKEDKSERLQSAIDKSKSPNNDKAA
jgi:putative FmdB family regulatory protein